MGQIGPAEETWIIEVPEEHEAPAFESPVEMPTEAPLEPVPV